MKCFLKQNNLIRKHILKRVQAKVLIIVTRIYNDIFKHYNGIFEHCNGNQC